MTGSVTITPTTLSYAALSFCGNTLYIDGNGAVTGKTNAPLAFGWSLPVVDSKVATMGWDEDKVSVEFKAGGVDKKIEAKIMKLTPNVSSIDKMEKAAKKEKGSTYDEKTFEVLLTRPPLPQAR